MTVALAIFPEEFALGLVGGPGWLTQVSTTRSGFEQRVSQRTRPRRVWEVSFEDRSAAELKVLRNFFLAVSGKAQGFLVKDFTDFESDGEQATSPAAGDGANKDFQLRKVYATDAALTPHEREIHYPKDGTVRVFLDGVEQLAGWSVNLATGVVSFAVAPGGGVAVTAEFEFYVPARFEVDDAQLSIEESEFYTWDGISLIELLEANN